MAAETRGGQAALLAAATRGIGKARPRGCEPTRVFPQAFPQPSVFTLQWNSRECEGACKLDNVSFLGAWEGEANTFLFLLYRMQSFSALALFTFWPDRNSLFGAG